MEQINFLYGAKFELDLINNKNGDIINQKQFDCEITNIEDGRNLIEAIGYKDMQK